MWVFFQFIYLMPNIYIYLKHSCLCAAWRQFASRWTYGRSRVIPWHPVLCPVYTLHTRWVDGLLVSHPHFHCRNMILEVRYRMCGLSLLLSECLNQHESLLWPVRLNMPEYRGPFKRHTAKQCHQIMVIYFGSSHVIILKFYWQVSTFRNADDFHG